MHAAQVAKFIMKISEKHPVFARESIGTLQEVFNHKVFLNGTEAEKREIMLRSSASKFENEMTYPWDNYFDTDISSFLAGKTVLDIGSFTGGRSAAWFERYKLKHITGVDVSQLYADAANHYASIRGINADFRFAVAENLPFMDEAFDAILTFDVFEHVQDLRKSLTECFRVLKSGGRLFLVFPGYFQPIEHHLGLVTSMPCLHWFFNGETLVKAYKDILNERGESAYWYRRATGSLESWERGHTINGTTLSQFRKMMSSMNWRIVHQSRKPIGSIGRKVSKSPLVRTASKLLMPLTFTPGLQEIFLHRITYILEKQGTKH